MLGQDPSMFSINPTGKLKKAKRRKQKYLVTKRKF
jgi:hypothetical protein